MKLSLTLVIACVASSQAFMTNPMGRTSGTKLLASQDSEAVKDALEASRKFGPSSKEARVAWDIVEEIRASDNSAAYSANDHDALADSSKNKEMYEKFLELQRLGELQRDHLDSVKHITEQIQQIKLSDPVKASAKDRLHNPILDQALTEAKHMTDKHGVASPQARLAWEAVEDIASDDLSEAMKKAVDEDEECLVEMIQACEAMEELNRALFLDEKKAHGRYHG